jgi:hypothetical protein
MIPRLLLGCVLGLALVTFAPGANAGMHPRHPPKEDCNQGQIAGVTPSAAACDDRIEDDNEVSRRRRHR